MIGSISVRNQKLVIDYDEYPVDPRSNDNLGVMVMGHKNYRLPNEIGLKLNEFDSWTDIENHLIDQFGAFVILPIYMYDHGGVTIKTSPFFDSWDSGKVGFIFATKKDILDNFTGYNQDGTREPMKRLLTKKMISHTKEILQGEVNEYDRYLRGDIYTFTLYERRGSYENCLYSVGNFYDVKDMVSDAPKAFHKKLRNEDYD